jgi:ABC-2 type transport system ATP-binding protein
MTENSNSSSSTLLSVSNLSYVYGAFHALSEVSFDTTSGQLISLVGRNGAGKSTLLKCIAGWTKPTDGSITIKGKLVNQQEREIREYVVLVPDTPPFYDELTAWEHLQLVAQLNGWQNWEDEADELLYRYGLLVNKSAYPFTFSRGMRYKLALCMALLIEPELLLLDEPLGPLDPVSADDLWQELNKHRANGMTILLSSHQLPAEAHPDRYIVMEGGQVIADGTPDDLRQRFNLDQFISLDNLLRSAIHNRKNAS